MAKKIKTFTVDENVYSSVVKLFKKSGAEVSISLFLNNCLEELLVLLQEVDRELKDTPEYTVPLSFIIKSIIDRNNILGIGQDIPDDMRMDILLKFWQEEYEAKQIKVPYQLYKYIAGNSAYMLSPDKKYLIDKTTGESYIPVGENRLVRIGEGKPKRKGMKK